MGHQHYFYIEYLADRLENIESKILSTVEGLVRINKKNRQATTGKIQLEIQIHKENAEKYILPQHLKYHNCPKYEEPSFSLDEQYPDNIG